jgi:UDP-GlcNAc:undecaprenyl-phosphate GlcNAc-1-phosphate transferase
MKYIIPFLVSFLITASLTPLVIRVANNCNCLDLPGERRLHSKPTPLWGGIAFFIGVLPFLAIDNSNSFASYIVASLLLVGIGIIDDLKSLGWKTKLIGMVAAATIVIFNEDIVIRHIGGFNSVKNIELGQLSIPFTYLCIIGITNAINLLDGLNGLAGGVSLLGFLFMGIAAVISGNLAIALICFAFVGALAAFLFFNFPHAKVFMGDTGSLFLGFSLALVALHLTQKTDASINPFFPVLVLLIPIFDTLRVLIVRLINGKNPFKGDNLHLHYLMVQKNSSAPYTVLIFWFATIAFGLVALTLMTNTSEAYLVVVLEAALLMGFLSASLSKPAITQPTSSHHQAATSSAGHQ